MAESSIGRGWGLLLSPPGSSSDAENESLKLLHATSPQGEMTGRWPEGRLALDPGAYLRGSQRSAGPLTPRPPPTSSMVPSGGGAPPPPIWLSSRERT